jgi:DeoR family transcriptional regulator, aga operon transcriptional repressor
MNAFERRKVIRELLSEKGMMEVCDLSQALQVSEVSVRRDLAFLEEQGFLSRIHGGAVLADGGSGGRAYALKVQLHTEEKQRIGKRAAELVQAGDHVILDSGSTMFEVARCLHANPSHPSDHITVVARSLPIIDLLGHRQGVKVVVLGGMFLPRYEMVGGPLALRFLQDLRVDKCFFGIDAVSIERGLMSDDPHDADLMQAMASAAREVILVVDSSKIGQQGFVSVLPIDRIHCLVTDAGAPDDFVRELKERNISVQIA